MGMLNSVVMRSKIVKDCSSIVLYELQTGSIPQNIKFHFHILLQKASASNFIYFDFKLT